MPITSGVYHNPGWYNNTTPAIDKGELDAISDTLEQVPVANGGTGKTSHTSNSVLLGNGQSALKNIASAAGAFYATSANAQPQFGTLPVSYGGSGKETHTANSVLVGNGTGALKNIASAIGALYSTGANAEPQFGTLPVSGGGTGNATNTANSVLVGNGANAVKNIASKAGALYATGANEQPQFGILPVACGGTGGSTAKAARNNLGLGNTTGPLPIANGGTGTNAVEHEDLLTGGGISGGMAYKWGKVVTVRIQTDQLDTSSLVSQAGCVPSGYRPSTRMPVVFGGGETGNIQTFDTTKGVMLGYIAPDGSIVTGSPTGKGYYYATVSYLLL